MSRRTLLSDITDKAEATFGSEITIKNYPDWELHWVATAEAWHSILVTEGLVETAKAVQEHIDFTKRYLTGKNIRPLIDSRQPDFKEKES